MQRYWKRYLLLIALVAILAYVTWRAYTDYQLRTYTRQIADTFPLLKEYGSLDSVNS